MQENSGWLFTWAITQLGDNKPRASRVLILDKNIFIASHAALHEAEPKLEETTISLKTTKSSNLQALCMQKHIHMHITLIQRILS